MTQDPAQDWNRNGSRASFRNSELARAAAIARWHASKTKQNDAALAAPGSEHPTPAPPHSLGKRLVAAAYDAADSLNSAELRDEAKVALLRAGAEYADRKAYDQVTPDSLIRTAYSDVPTCPHCKLPLV